MINMKNVKAIALSMIIASQFVVSECSAKSTLKDIVGKYFNICAAVNSDIVWNRDAADAQIVKDNYNCIVAENCMKGEVIHPEEYKYFWDDADQTVKFAEENGMKIIGHCLVWHSQPPRWMFTDAEGKNVSRDTLIDRMHKHIAAVVGRYKNKILGWDVVNEVVNDDGTMRETPYYKIIGPDYIELAFRFAHEADPNAELYINDYSTANKSKRETICRIVKDLKAKGLRVDAIGMQSHNGLSYPDINEYEKSMEAFAACGVKVMITEFDINMLPNPEHFGGAEVSLNYKYDAKYNPYPNGLNADAKKKFDKRIMEFFNVYYRHRDVISRFTTWGVSDGTSWLNGWPIKGRVNYPLLFDRNHKAKSVVKNIIKLFKK